MATKEVYVGGIGPLQYDDTDFPAGIELDGDIKMSGLTASRIMGIDASNYIETINLHTYLNAGDGINITDYGSGIAQISGRTGYVGLYINSGLTFTFAVAATDYALTFQIAGTARAITLGGASNLTTMSPDNTDFYKTIFTATLKAANAGDTFTFTVYQNSTAKTKSATKIYLPDNTNYYNVALHMDGSVTAGNTISIKIANDSGTNNLEIYRAQVSMLRM